MIGIFMGDYSWKSYCAQGRWREENVLIKYIQNIFAINIIMKFIILAMSSSSDKEKNFMASEKFESLPSCFCSVCVFSSF